MHLSAGGTAGSVVASRLSDIPTWKVLVLEAGPDAPPVASVPSVSAMFIGTILIVLFQRNNWLFYTFVI